MDWRLVHRGIRARFATQRAELRTLMQALAPDDIAVDVGANKGSYAWSLSRAVPRGKVVAFEPQPFLAAYLADAFQKSGITNVVVEGAGVSATSGRLTLAIPGDKPSSPGASFEQAHLASEPCKSVEVKVVSLDDYFAGEPGRIGAIKIDVEGHELEVLRGAARLIAEQRPILVFECEQRVLPRGTVLDVLEYAKSLNYVGYFVWKAKLHPIDQFDPDFHQSRVGKRFWRSPNYCNNFVFKPL